MQLSKHENEREWKFLLYFCQAAILKMPCLQQEKIDVSLINWNNLFYLASLHKVRLLLYHGLKKWDRQHLLPTHFLNQLKVHAIHFTKNNLLNAQELETLVGLFKERGVEIIPYKGLILAKEAYDSVQLREGEDIDFLFRQADYPTILTVLLQRNYLPATPLPKYFETRYFKHNCEFSFSLNGKNQNIYLLDAHWRIAPRIMQIDLGLDDFLPLTTSKSFFKTNIPTLTPEGLLLTSCLHHAGKERFQSLKYICDIAALLQQYEATLDWTLLLKKAKKWKVTNLVLLGVGLTAYVFSIQLPQQINELVKAKKIDRQIHLLAEELSQRKESSALGQESILQMFWFQVSFRRYWFTRTKILYYSIIHLFSPSVADIKTENLSKLEYWLLVFTKPFRLWNKYVLNRV